jgi:hypothetical protein
MRVLHIWNTAGVASTLAKWQKKLFGWDTWVVTRKNFDKFGLTIYGETWNTLAKVFKAKILLLSRKYDIIHVHSLDEIVPLLKKIYRKKPVVLHYHGTDIRNLWKEKSNRWSKADLLLVSTPDLLERAPKHAIYLPSPIDTDLFKPLRLHNDNTALYIEYNARDLAEFYAEKYGLKLTIHDRSSDPIPYSQMSKFLNEFSWYIDTRRDKNGNLLKNLSKTALEALACGLKVIEWDGKILNELPDNHKPEQVVKKLRDLYLEILTFKSKDAL